MGSDNRLTSNKSGGNTDFYKNFIWELLEEDISCTKYTVRLRDADMDGIFDIIDADIDNDGNTDSGKAIVITMVILMVMIKMITVME